MSFPIDDLTCNALFGSGFHHRTAAGIFQTSQYLSRHVLCHWALIGFTKTYFFHIPEDFLLASSAVPGLYLFFKEYTASHLHTSTLFRARMINLALIIACGAIGVLFMISMVCELAQEQALSK